MSWSAWEISIEETFNNSVLMSNSINWTIACCNTILATIYCTNIKVHVFIYMCRCIYMYVCIPKHCPVLLILKFIGRIRSHFGRVFLQYLLSQWIKEVPFFAALLNNFLILRFFFHFAFIILCLVIIITMQVNAKKMFQKAEQLLESHR